MSEPSPQAEPEERRVGLIEPLRVEVSALAARSRVGGLFYLAGWLLVAVASQGYARYPLACTVLAGLFAFQAVARFLLRPALAAERRVLLRLRSLHWGLLLGSAVLWSGALVWVMVDPAFDTTRPAAVVCSILYATAFAHSYPMSLRATLIGMALIYLPAPLLANEDTGGLAVQVALGVYALYLSATALRSRREYLEQLDLQANLRDQRDRFEQLSQRDGLTGLLNHAECATRIARAGNTCRRASDRLSLVLLDIDHFKQVNDQLGHPVGDELLVAFARRLQQHFAHSSSVTVARWGGEEFAVLLPGVPLEAARRMAESLLASLRDQPLLAGRPAVRASIGVGQMSAGDDPSALLLRVDQALYRAKAEGRDRVVEAPAPPGQSVTNRA